VGGMMEKTGKSAEQIITDFKNMTPEARSLFLTQMMGADNVTKANEDYKKSWEHTKESVDRAYASLKRIIGDIIQPILIPLLDQLTNTLTVLANGLQSLDGPTKTIVGYILLFVAGLVSLAAIIGFVNGIMTILGIRTGLAAIAHGAHAAAVGVSAIAYGVYTAALGVATAAQWALNLAMSANPIGIIIIAIIAIIAVLIYFWETNEGFRNAVIAAWEALKGAVMGAIDWITSGLQWLWGSLQGIWNNIVGWATGISQSASAAGSGFINNIISFFTQLPGRIWTFLVNTASRILSFASTAAQYARNAGSQIVSNIISIISQLPGQMYRWGVNAINSFINAIINAIPGLRWALDQVARLFPHSQPKEGPLSKIKPENSYKFGSNIIENLNKGLGSETNELFNFITPIKPHALVKKETKLISGKNEINLNITHDFKNIPTQLNKEELLKVFKSMTTNPELIDTLIKMLSRAKLNTKTNLGI
jgi:hypothetical protein